MLLSFLYSAGSKYDFSNFPTSIAVDLALFCKRGEMTLLELLGKVNAKGEFRISEMGTDAQSPVCGALSTRNGRRMLQADFAVSGGAEHHAGV